MLFVFTPWGFPIYTISLRRLRASPFPPHVPVRAPRARDESDLFLPPRTLFVFQDTPRHSTRPGVGRPPELARWRSPGGTPVWRTASLAPTLPSSGPGRLAVSVLLIHTPPPARGQTRPTSLVLSPSDGTLATRGFGDSARSTKEERGVLIEMR
ncbi:hypothetical protein RSOLAG1IB_11162 [Rhizoctonia solani AG-1 IB]|uniref:Uncharacterized protein n=1 Tax=Thanatephorus cucumeris (strain AG1-IB / isolate 7/3/14) TaxID=1108050 RepID=A0A0B7F998_THACB|nr:hypothetical protein RSOLAG1IB_11162 [Rhizoctonia solani AG-1 IB]